MRKAAFIVASLGVLFVVVVCHGLVYADKSPSINVRLRLVDRENRPTTKDVYRLDKEVVRFAIYQQNVGQTGIIASEKYVRKDFHLNLHLYVTGADGKEKLITANYPEGVAEPPPPLVKLVGNQLVSVEPVEILPGGWTWTVAFDAPDYYDLVAGKYSAKVVIPVTTYNDKALLKIDGKSYARIDDPSKYANTYDPIESIHPVTFSIIADSDNDGWYFPAPDEKTAADCDDTNPSVNPAATEVLNNGLDDDCNAATPDKPVIQNKTLIIRSDRYKVGPGNHPAVEKQPHNGVKVRVFNYPEGTCCGQRFGPTWHYYESIWKSGELGDCCSIQTEGITGYKKPGVEGEQGAVTFSLPPGDYLVIGKPEDENVYMGVRAVVLKSDRVLEKYLPHIINAKGETLPGKFAEISEADLLIIEPEYVEWDGAQEYYPIIFDASGNWTVTALLNPPEGFMPDHNSFNQKLNNETKAVQFKLTEKGATWKETKIGYIIQHQGKAERVTGKIDVKLSERLAEKKGLSIYGLAGDPWKKKEKE